MGLFNKKQTFRRVLRPWSIPKNNDSPNEYSWTTPYHNPLETLGQLATLAPVPVDHLAIVEGVSCRRMAPLCSSIRVLRRFPVSPTYSTSHRLHSKPWVTFDFSLGSRGSLGRIKMVRRVFTGLCVADMSYLDKRHTVGSVASCI